MHRPTQVVRLSTYATLAAGTTVGGSAATAGVIYVDVAPQDVSNNFTLDLTAAGFGAHNYTFSNIAAEGPTISAKITGTDQMQERPLFLARNLVGYTQFISNSVGSNDRTSFNNPDPGRAYLGFRIGFGGGARVGWIEFVNDGNSVTVSRWAYESEVGSGITTPNESFNGGGGGGGGGAVPGLGGLAALACGAAGMRRSRNRVA